MLVYKLQVKLGFNNFVHIHRSFSLYCNASWDLYCRQGHLGMVVLLMKYNADPTLRDGEGCACVHLAAQFGHTAIVAYLLARGDNVNLLDKNGMTPLMWSAYRVTR